MNKLLFLFGLLVCIILFCLFFKYEGFQNLANPGIYPISEDEPLLADTYPYIGSNKLSEKNYQDIWWKYPIFSVGSYAQITNNLRYRKNPDDGECIRADFCDSLYRDKEVLSNISQPLSPVPETMTGVRINYYNTEENLFLGPQAGPELPVFA